MPRRATRPTFSSSLCSLYFSSFPSVGNLAGLVERRARSLAPILRSAGMHLPRCVLDDAKGHAWLTAVLPIGYIGGLAGAMPASHVGLDELLSALVKLDRRLSRLTLAPGPDRDRVKEARRSIREMRELLRERAEEEEEEE